MSNANAAAKKRRANMTPAQIQQQMQQSSSSVTSVSSSEKQRQGLTLPQVISLVDARLTKLEDIVLKEPKEWNTNNTEMLNTNQDDNVKQILLEYEDRFTMLVTQISDLKEIVLKLQSYTMDVNKTLLEERIHFMSESNMENIEASIQSSSLKLDDLKLQEPEIVTSYVPNPIED
jgi:hypothetical protein